MTLNRLLDLAYMCEFVDLSELDEISLIARTWEDLLDRNLEDLQLSEVPHE